jgi:hypothetical protein
MEKLATDAARDGERVQRFDDSVLGVDEDLRDFGHGDAVVDRDLRGVLLDLQRPAEAPVGEEQPRRRRPAGKGE